MTDIVTDDIAAETVDEQAQDLPEIEDEAVVEEVSIDGMCGVY